MAKDAICFDTGTVPNELEDDAFLQQLKWRKSADPRLRESAETGRPDQFGRALARTLKRDRGARRSKQATPALLQPLWSRHAFDDAVGTDLGAVLLTKLQQTLDAGKSNSRVRADIGKLVERALAIASSTPTSPWLLSCWLTILSEVGAKLSPTVLFRLWRHTLEASLRVMHLEGFSPDGGDGFQLDDRRLLVQGELPWRMGVCFHDLRGAGKLRKAGRACLREGLEAITDGDGTPHAASLHRLPLTLAVLTRSVHVGELASDPLWNRQSAERFESLIAKAASLCLSDGRIALSNGASFAPASLMRTASQLAGLSKRDPSSRRLLSLPDDNPTLEGKGRRSFPALKPLKRLPNFEEDESPSTQSDWAELACLRNNWLSGADSCVVAHHQSPPQICLTAFERVLLDGHWSAELLLDGKPLELDQEWGCVCWYSDEDADYLELQQESEGVTFCRQVMLSRTDHWLYLADAVIAEQGEKIELTSHLPLAEGVTGETNRWSRELRLAQRKLKATVYPLALDQQRVVHAHGSLEVGEDDIVLHQTGVGGALYAPLVIDWSPDRRRSQSQWRRLTVAEDGAILSNDQASGFRLRVGSHQWLFYRSLRPGQTARTVLGHHTPHESVIADFTADGNVEPLVMVE